MRPQITAVYLGIILTLCEAYPFALVSPPSFHSIPVEQLISVLTLFRSEVQDFDILLRCVRLLHTITCLLVIDSGKNGPKEWIERSLSRNAVLVFRVSHKQLNFPVEDVIALSLHAVFAAYV